MTRVAIPEKQLSGEREGYAAVASTTLDDHDGDCDDDGTTY